MRFLGIPSSLRRYSIALTLHQSIFVYSFERIYFLARGLSITEMIVLEVMYNALVFVLDIPTGALADRWGRKPLLVAARVFTFFEFFVIGFATNFGMFVLAIFSAALGTVCFSGTGHAFVYDTLKQDGIADEFERVQGRLELFSNAAVLLGGIVGAVVANFDLALPYFLTSAFMAVAVLVTLTLREPTRADSTPPDDESASPLSFLDHIRTAFGFVLAHSTIRSVLLYGALLGGVFIYADEFYQVYANAIGIPLYWLGLLSAAAVAIESVGSAGAYRVRKRFGYAASLRTVVVVGALLLFAASQLSNLVGLGLILLMFGLHDMARTLNYGLLHSNVESFRRATVDSAYTMLVNLLSVGIGFTFAWVADTYSIFSAYLFLAALMALYGVYYLFTRQAPGNAETRSL